MKLKRFGKIVMLLLFLTGIIVVGFVVYDLFLPFDIERSSRLDSWTMPILISLMVLSFFVRAYVFTRDTDEKQKEIEGDGK